MLRFSEAQMRKMEQLEEKEFVNLIYRDLLNTHPDLQNDEQLQGRLTDAYTHLKSLGFSDSDVIFQFLTVEALAPRFYRQPPIDAWLRKPGQAMEQRFLDLLSAAQAHLRHREY